MKPPLIASTMFEIVVPRLTYVIVPGIILKPPRRKFLIETLVIPRT